MMKISKKGIELIKKFEGLRHEAYQDSVGVWTIGYGHTSTAKRGMTINDMKATRLLKFDLQHAERVVNSYNLNINQNQFDTLVSFVFNLGSGNFQRSTLLKKIQSDPCDKSIKHEFNRWIYAGGKVLQGLVKRRKAEAELYFDCLV